MPRHSAPQQSAWLRPRLAVAYVVAAAGLVTAIWLPARSDSADASERFPGASYDGRFPGASYDGRYPGGSYDGWWGRDQIRPLPAFADDFGGGRGDTVDPAKWMVLTGTQFSPDTPNALLDGDGNLVITASENDTGGVTSARLLTRNALRAPSGHVEARIKTPDGEGLEPAFRLLGAGRPSTEQTRTEQTSTEQTSPDQTSTDRPRFGSINVLAEPRSDDFHTYAVDWTPDEVVFSVDGRELERVAPQTLDSNQPFRLSLSLTAGDGASTPARMLVDSVSFSANEASQAPTTPPTTPPSSEPTTAPTTAPPTTPPTSAPVSTKWEPFTDYVAGQLVTYKGVEYQVQETHTSLPGWEPTALPSLFKKL